LKRKSRGKLKALKLVLKSQKRRQRPTTRIAAENRGYYWRRKFEIRKDCHFQGEELLKMAV